MSEKTSKNCNDENCPIHGNLKTRKKIFVGTVINDKMQKSATIVFERITKNKKYERYGKKRTKIKVHNPPCINAKVGELVKTIECRPLSKTINFVIVEKLGKGERFHKRDEDLVEKKEKTVTKSEKKVEESKE